MNRWLSPKSAAARRPWRAVAGAFVLFGGVGMAAVLAGPLLGLNGPGALRQWMGAGAPGPLAPIIAVASFTGLAFLGAPQFVLIAAAVVAFGPVLGFAYSWVGTLVSAIVGFWLGRRFGAQVLHAYAGRGLQHFLDLVGRNGLIASFAVRLAPSAPFIIVNMAAGVTPMRLRAFVLGTALGIIPKIAVTAFAGGAFSGHAGAGLLRWGGLVLAVFVWAAAALGARWVFRRSGAPSPPKGETSDALPGRAGAP
jgi:uncharacterized membrane protein YdjX (TVP38/TMEM64 family)